MVLKRLDLTLYQQRSWIISGALRDVMVRCKRRVGERLVVSVDSGGATIAPSMFTKQTVSFSLVNYSTLLDVIID
jgi:hypothetical protein